MNLSMLNSVFLNIFFRAYKQLIATIDELQKEYGDDLSKES